MKILVTGGTGFIGSAAIRQLLAGGHEVTALVRNPDTIPADLKKSVLWVNKSLCEFEIKDAPVEKYDACLHAAWIATPGVYLHSPVNRELVTESLAFIGKLRKTSISRILVMGTCFEYAPSEIPVREDSAPLKPSSIYGESKIELHDRLLQSVANTDLQLAWGRIFYPYGPGENPRRLTSAIIKSLDKNEMVTLRTPHSIKDFIYIDDVAGAVRCLLESAPSGTYNIGTGTGHAIESVARTLAAHMGKPDKIELSPTPDIDYYPTIVADMTKLQNLGWKPKTSITAGLQNLIDSVRLN